MAVLYRKYRPQTFAEVIGQKYVSQTLKNQVQAGQPAHAYLFTGSRGVGKTSVARIFAKAVNCKHSKENAGDACGSCSVCSQIENGNFMDLVEIDAASNTGVDNIRDLIEHIKFSPNIGAYKVFIIDEVHMLSKGAFNALLKTLEEPPSHAIFILATTEITKVPATVISRTQRFDFHALSLEENEKLLNEIIDKEKIKFPREILGLIAKHAEGSGRDALSLLGKVLTLGEKVTVEECQQLLGVTDYAILGKLLELIVSGNDSLIPEFFESLAERGADMLGFNRDFLEFLHEALIYKVTLSESEISSHSFKDILKDLSVGDLIFITRLFLRSFKEIATSPSPDIPLLLAALEATAKKKVILAPVTTIPLKNDLINLNPVAVKSTEVISESVAEFKQSPSQEENNVIADSELKDFVDVEVTLADIKKVWPELINKLKDINGPLANLVKISPLQRVERGRVILGVKYTFHKQNIEQQKNSSIINTILKELTGRQVGIGAEIIKEIPVIGTAAGITEALAVFGGELLE